MEQRATRDKRERRSSKVYSAPPNRRDKYWPGRKDKTFRSNWKNTVAQIIIGEAAKGARAQSEHFFIKHIVAISSSFLTDDTCGLSRHLTLPTDASFDAAEEPEDYGIKEEEDIEDMKTPKVNKPPMPPGPKVSKNESATSYVDDHLGGSFRGMSLNRTPSYSLDTIRPYQMKTYVQDNKNRIDVEVHLGGYVGNDNEDGIKTDVVDNGMSLSVNIGTIKAFADPKRHQAQLGVNFHPNDCVILLLRTHCRR